MRNFILLIGLLISVQIFGQEDNETDVLSEIKKQDVSDLFTLDKFNIENDTVFVERQQPIGYIGSNFQRLYIRFISVIKNPSNPADYLVYGKSKVKNNICSFQGKLTIDKSKLYDDSEYPELKEGYINGAYEFYEDPDQKGTGIFKGRFKTNFYFNEKNELKYDALMWYADGYQNNQFEGTWTDYKSSDSKKCNWGDYRIPDSDGLDIGVGEFSPDDKYKDCGWDTYICFYLQSSDTPEASKAKQKENEKWWIDKK
jgi:hypothetical protein